MRETISINTTIIHSHSHIEIQLSQLDVLHFTTDDFRSDVSVNGSTSTRIGITLTRNGDRSTRLEVGKELPGREFIFINLSLDRRLD